MYNHYIHYWIGISRVVVLKYLKFHLDLCYLSAMCSLSFCYFLHWFSFVDCLLLLLYLRWNLEALGTLELRRSALEDDFEEEEEKDEDDQLANDSEDNEKVLFYPRFVT